MNKNDNEIPIAKEVYIHQNTSSYIIEPSAPPYILMTSETIDENNTNNTETIEIEKEEQYCGKISFCYCIALTILFWPLALCVPLCPCDKRKKIIRIYK